MEGKNYYSKSCIMACKVVFVVAIIVTASINYFEIYVYAT